MKDGITLQIKPVGNSCNIECKYCYASPFKKTSFKVMDIKLLEKIIKDATDTTDTLTISWHGGEPTLAGLNFFKSYMEIASQYSKKCKIINMIQTNATLINDDFASFFKDNNFIVSVSLDGVKKCHDLNRVDFSNIGTFDRVMKGVFCLRKYGLNPPIICTVSKDNLSNAKENYEFFINNGFKEIKYSPVYDSYDDSFSISSDQWFDYIFQVFILWLQNRDKTIKIRDIDEILAYYSKKSLPLCYNENACSKWISIDEQGNMYPCEYLRIDHYYGNISTTSISDVFNTSQYQDFKKKIEFLPEECIKCDILTICHNGCPATRIRNNKLEQDGKYVYCSERKKLFIEIDKLLKR